jgi:cytochrome d ubiquinol oxidase subunit II
VSGFWSSIGLPQIIAGILVVALNAYVLLGGADYGGGVWDLLASGPRREAQRDEIARSLAPIWEANHVWLIVVVVVLFTAFPSAFQDLSIVLHIPLTIMLVGIVLRGSAFVFRSYGNPSRTHRRRWGMAFAIASVITPIVLGMMIGALVTGKVGDAARRIESSDANFASVFVSPWLGGFQLAVGLFALVLFAFLAAVYLAYGTSDEQLREDFRRRALASAIALFVIAAVALLLGKTASPVVQRGVAAIGSSWAVVLHVLTGIAAIAAIVALVRRRYALARIAAAAQVSCILWGWAFSQYPELIPNRITIADAAAPRETMVLLLIGLAAGTAILVPALRYLFGLFARSGAVESR